MASEKLTGDKAMNRVNRAALIVFCGMTAIVACTAPAGDAPAVDEAAAMQDVDAAVTGMLQAYAANDVETYFAFFADDATLMTNGGRIQPVAEYHDGWAKLIGGGGGVVSVDADAPRTVRLAENGKTAIVLTEGIPATYRFPDPSNDGEFNTVDNVWTESVVWSNFDGTWKIEHFHYHDATD